MGKWEKKEDQCFLWPSTWENWVRAEEYCKNEGGHLASVTNRRIHDYVRSRIDLNHHETQFLVGGRRSKGKWKWTDESQWEFKKWASGQPDNYLGRENCLQVWKRGWNDLRCDRGGINNFVCSQWICPNNHTNNNGNNPKTDADITVPSINKTTNQINNQKGTRYLPMIAILSGILLIAGITVVIGCVVCKRPKRNKRWWRLTKTLCMESINSRRRMKDNTAPMSLLPKPFLPNQEDNNSTWDFQEDHHENSGGEGDRLQHPTV